MKYLYLLSLLGLLMSSCYEDKELFIPDQQYKINNALLINSLVGEPESFIVDLNNDPIVSLPGGIQLEWPENKVRDIEGNVVTGTIRVEFKEYTQPRTGLMNCPETRSNNQWINSTKTISLKISNRDKPIQLTGPVTLYIPSKENIEDINVYNLSKEGNNTQWALSPGSTENMEYGNWLINSNKSPAKEISGYKIQTMPGQDWIMLGKPLGNKIGLEVKCTLNSPQGFNNSNALAYFIGDQNNIVFKMDYDAVNRQFYTNSGVTGHNIQGKIIFIGQTSEENYYFGTTNVVLGSDTNLKINGTAMSLESIKAALKRL